MDEYELMLHALAMFESTEKALEWLTTPISEFGNIPPFMAVEYYGQDVVERIVDECF